MKPEQLFQELKTLAEKLNLRVMEQNFRTTGIRVKSGYCKVKGIDHCIIDKHIKVNQKAEVLAECLSQMPLESIYIIPAVREFLDQFKATRSDSEKGSDAEENASEKAPV